MDMESLSAAAHPPIRDSGSDSDVDIIESKSMDNPSAAPFLDPRRMYAQIPSALATPPQSPTDDGWPPNQAAEMPLVTDLLARNGQLNVPPGFVLCIPCYLCNQPFNDIDSFKEHLTLHAAEIHAWHAAQKPPMQPIQPPTQPMFQPFRPWPMEFPQQQPPPPMVSIPGPGAIQPPMSFPMPLSKPMSMNQPPMQFPMQLHQEMPAQPPLEFPGHYPVHQTQPREYPFHQRLHRSVPLTPQSPIEMMEQQFGYQKIPPFPPQYQPAMELHHKPHFMVQQPAPPPVELQRIFLKKPIEAQDQQIPKEQPPQLQEENLKDQFSIEKRLHIPPSMELQRIVLQKPQEPVPSPIEAEESNFAAVQSQPQSPELRQLANQRQLCIPPQKELQKPQEPVPSPNKAEESSFPAAQSQPQSPELRQLANQRQLWIPPEKELLPEKTSKAPYERDAGRFQCDYCGKRLSSRQSVRYHQSRFHFMEDPPTYKVSKKVQKHFRCTTCKKRYKRRTFLLMHMKIKHGICRGEATDAAVPPAAVESPEDEAPLSPERPSSSSSSSSSEGTRREVWSTKVFNAVAAASYSPATEPAAKYVNAPRQQSEILESGFGAKPKRVYPMRSPFFNPDLWLDCDAYF